MRPRLRRVFGPLLERRSENGPGTITLPDGREYVRIERPSPIRRRDMPTRNTYRSEREKAERREAALSIIDPETHGFLLVVLKPGTPPARLTAQVHPAWRGYLGGVLGSVLRQYARDLKRAHAHSGRA